MSSPNNANGTSHESPQSKDSKPPNNEGADKATQDNDLTTGHNDPDDGGDDNAEEWCSVETRILG